MISFFCGMWFLVCPDIQSGDVAAVIFCTGNTDCQCEGWNIEYWRQWLERWQSILTCCFQVCPQLSISGVILTKAEPIRAFVCVAVMFECVNHDRNCQQSYLLLFGIPSPTHSFIPGFKTSFSANLSLCSPSFLLLKYLLRGFPGLFTVISEHICFLLLVFSVFTLFSFPFRAVD